jgi:ubiquinone/menaquinone biosynthesis C-methylase UbiE
MELSEHTRRYWQYEYDVAAKYMVPLLEEWGALRQGMSMIDVGCGEGGGVCAMHDSGMQCVGWDADDHRVRVAALLQGNRSIQWSLGSLYENSLPFSGQSFDLVVLHDVFEHLERKEEMLGKLRTYLNPDGRLMITFPPYYSAYGAHQQLLNSPIARVPFFHLLPFTLRWILPRLKNESPVVVDEVRKLGTLKMGMRKFEEIARSGGMKVVAKRAYVISPNHIRFGLKPIPAGPVGDLPILGELLCTGAVYLLARA